MCWNAENVRNRQLFQRSRIHTLKGKNLMMVSFFIQHQHWHLLRPFLSGKGDYELHRAWCSASIAAKAITCCDRDKEAPSPCRRLIDWAVKKGEMSFTMGREGRRAQWYSHSPPRTLHFAKLILPVDIKEPQLTLGLSSTRNVRWDGCKWSRFIKYCLLLSDWTFFFFFTLIKTAKMHKP